MRLTRSRSIALRCAILLSVALPALPFRTAHSAERTVPILYSTDLFHPPDDADDTFDAATLFAIEEFDIRGVILDNARGRQVGDSVGARFRQRLGRPPLEQLMRITGRKVEFAPGLPQPLRSATDRGLDQPKEYQGAVEMILSCLRRSQEKVILLNVGSCRDFAAALNRDPELFRRKVKAIYCNAGTVVDRGDVAQDDFNVTLDPWAFFRMFDSGVPVYWCGTRPKMSERAPGGLYSTSYWVHQQRIIRAGTEPVENYFIYALTQSKADPLAFLGSGFQRIPLGRAMEGDGGWFMWCTGPMCHAAGRSIYRQGIANFMAMQPDEAERAGLADKKIELFDFVPVTVAPKEPPRVLSLDFKKPVADPKVVAFRRAVSDTDYRTVMESVLANLIAGLGRTGLKTGP